MQYDLKNKVIITDVNSGIGKAASIQLAKLGATVVMPCRSGQRGLQAVDEVRSTAQSSRVGLMQGDMSLQRSIREVAGEFHRRIGVYE
jgi:Dehydrogenases with different specificities (related to short-chain alcohol dehydrogenases)